MKSRRPLSERPYRKGVGAVLFDRRGLVFVGRRIDTIADAWQLPQGGIDAGETPRQAVVRELAEEVGTDKADILAVTRDWLSYDLPADLADRVWKGRYRGQRQIWFALRLTGTDDDIDLAASKHPEFSDWKWMPLTDLPAVIVPFKRPLYEDLVDEFKAYARPVERTGLAPGSPDVANE